VCVLGRFPALAGADLDVEPGEIVLLSGANGAGKTTLLRLLAGLLPLRSGRATVLGTDLTVDRRSHRRRLALVGHDTGCYDDLTVGENVRFALRMAGAIQHRKDDGDVVEGALARFDLVDQARVTHRKLSTGQRRRLALATALAREPELLLLDEPHAGLDADGRALLDDQLADAARAGRTVILASHELERARALAHREVIVDAGILRNGVLATTATDPPASQSQPQAIGAGA
jgi:heme ABC exporter ATP-binding subunit CcmA